MTEAEWLTAANPEPMLQFLMRRRRHSRPIASDRKLTLFACACCRRIWNLMPTDLCREAVAVGERFADGLATTDQRNAVWSSAFDAVVAEGIRIDDAYHGESIDWGFVPGGLAALAALGVVGSGEIEYDRVLRLAVGEAVIEQTGIGFQNEQAVDRVNASENAVLAALLRHIVGNPFQPFVATWPDVVVRLAESLYDGADVAFALTDALLEAGYPELAKHFRAEPWHPKGCWLIDQITGRK